MNSEWNKIENPISGEWGVFPGDFDIWELYGKVVINGSKYLLDKLSNHSMNKSTIVPILLAKKIPLVGLLPRGFFFWELYGIK